MQTNMHALYAIFFLCREDGNWWKKFPGTNNWGQNNWFWRGEKSA